MNKNFWVFIGIMIMVLPGYAFAYTSEEGKLVLDNSDVASIISDYDGNVRDYISPIVGVAEQKPFSRLSLMLLSTSQACNPSCQGCSSCSCTDDDIPDDIEVFGTVETQYTFNTFIIQGKFTDICMNDLGGQFAGDTHLLQVSCDNNEFCNYVKWVKYDCPNQDCNNGTCTKPAIPEFTTAGLLLAGILSILVMLTLRRKMAHR